jgi:hypothetical protein
MFRASWMLFLRRKDVVFVFLFLPTVASGSVELINNSASPKSRETGSNTRQWRRVSHDYPALRARGRKMILGMERVRMQRMGWKGRRGVVEWVVQ